MNTDTTPKGNLENLDKFHEQMEKEQEDRLIDFIVEIIVSARLKRILWAD